MAAKTFLKTTLTISLFFVVFVVSETAHAKTIYVDDNGPADFSNIQAAIDDANDGDIIIVNTGTYTGDGNRDIDFKGKAITVRSTDPNDPNIVAATVIDCEGSDEDNHRGFYFRSGEDENSILEGLTITNGLHSTGAGICCLGSSPAIRNNIITGNETGFDEDGGAGIGCWYGASPTIANNIISDNVCAPGGGGGGIRCFDRCSPAITNCTISRNSPQGINIHNGKPTISNCTFEGNLGGGISSSYFSSPIFINCTFIGNSSPAGGGMHIYESNPTLINCCFIQNVATTHGGGIWIYGWDTSSPTLINCTFAGNSAGNYGGGMYSRDNTNSMLVNCTFTGNSADDAGGAVYNYGYDRSVRITLKNCTFSGNSAAKGNDLACDSPYGPPSNVQVANCVIWDGENPIWNNDGSTITINYSDVHGGWPGQGNIDADPCFVDPDGVDDILGTEDDNLRLLSDSLCIDAGDPNYIAGPNETDLDGKPRVIAGRIDMGAYEFQSYLILYVDADATGANDGSSWTDAFNFLQDALAIAYYGDEIRVAQGIYKPDQGNGITPGDREVTFQLKTGVAIKGSYAGFGEPEPNARDIDSYETILSGDIGTPIYSWDNCYHVVTASVTDETAVLNGFTITGGCANIGDDSQHFGGGMLNNHSSPTLTNCTFIGNRAISGGGMANSSSHPMLTNCTFTGNWASIWGAGLYNYKSSPTLTNCTFTRNFSAQSSGGGMVNNVKSSPTLTNCTFTGNSAAYGGGMVNLYDGKPSLRNCIFSGNSASYHGGGIVNIRSNLTLTNCTFAGNAATNGNALGFDSYLHQEPSNVQITNCILWEGGEEIWNNDGSTIAITYSDVESGWPGEGNIDADPCFVDPANGDYHLLESSPCIDAGDPNYVPAPDETDLDGEPRVLDGDNDGIAVVDMGAYEYRFTISAEARILPQTINLASKGNWITCYIWLPEQYNVADIDPNSIFLEDEVQPVQFSVDEQSQLVTTRFTREEAQTILEVGDIELTITGRLNDGAVFEATDTIKVIDKAGEK